MFDSGVVLGIDPGLSRCGYGAVRRGRGGQAEAVAYGVIRTSKDDPLEIRLLALSRELEDLVDELQPVAVAVERVLFQVNVRTAMSVGQASGLAMVAAARRGIPLTHYSPNEVKQAVVGYGGADKLQVQTMVTALLRLDVMPDPPDAADALALALAHSWAGVLRARTDLAGDVGAGAGVGAPAGGRNPKLQAAVDAAIAKEGSR